jgi:hypothetical protein
VSVVGARASLYTSNFAIFHDSISPIPGTIGGGCISTNAAYFSIVDTKFKNCSSPNAQGGALALWLGSGVVQRSLFIANSAAWGGAVLDYAVASFTNCTFSNNSASAGASAILAFWSVAISGCDFVGNAAAFSHGALYLYTSSLSQSTVDRCRFLNNSVSAAFDGSYGGAIVVNATGPNVISNSVFDSNSANFGGAIYLLESVNISKCVFSRNVANGVTKARGGAIYARLQSASRRLQIVDSSFDSNTVQLRNGVLTGSGGALDVASTQTTVIISSTVFNTNRAFQGGAVALNYNFQSSISSTSLTGNLCGSAGCGIMLLGSVGSETSIVDSQFNQNAFLPGSTLSWSGAGLCAYS